ncbi:MAG: hypothetical protein ABJZ55_17905 [Fuerstiella sp.]
MSVNQRHGEDVFEGKQNQQLAEGSEIVSFDKHHAFDEDVERAFDWLISFLPMSDWTNRKARIHKFLEEALRPDTAITQDQIARLCGKDDAIAWYLYQVHMTQHEPCSAEPAQASRILPVFKRLGMNLEVVKELHGINAQVERLLGASRNHPDQVLFEILIAVVWKLNGWDEVSFIPPSKSQKLPDLKAIRGNDTWHVETKRMMPHSGYSRKEREKWLKIWALLKTTLMEGRYPFILDVTFHTEMLALDDSVLVEKLADKLKLVTFPCHLVSDDTMDVHVSFVDLRKIKRHLEDWSVKMPSRQLIELIGGRWDRSSSFTHVMKCATRRAGDAGGLNLYVDEIDWAAGAYWHCDAEKATEAKARDIRSHLSKAVSQLPDAGPGVIHVGMETYDGEAVEAERFERIMRTVTAFDTGGKDLQWIFAHLMECYSPPDKSWVADETVYPFGRGNREDSPVPMSSCLVPHEMFDHVHAAHWMRDAP